MIRIRFRITVLFLAVQISGGWAFADARDLVPRFGHLDRIHARAAWAHSVGAGVLVAVVDTGVDVTHPAFKNTVVHAGWDFIDDDDDPTDPDGHGTHVGALILGTPTGAAPMAELLPIRALTSDGGDLDVIARAIRFAVDRGARIINLSAGAARATEHAGLAAAVDYAGAFDVLIVTAAGNGDPATGLGLDLDQSPLYPASFRRPHLLTVAASDAFEPLAVYSNYGKETVDVTAPGGFLPDDPVWSASIAWRGGRWWEPRAGTSAAAPLAAGVAALIRARRPDLTAAVVRDVVARSGEQTPALTEITRTGRALDAGRAMAHALTLGSGPDQKPSTSPE